MDVNGNWLEESLANNADLCAELVKQPDTNDESSNVQKTMCRMIARMST